MSCNCKDIYEYEHKYDGQDNKNIDEQYLNRKYKRNTFSPLLYDMYGDTYAISKGNGSDFAKIYP